MVRKYQQKVSGPLLDRIDLHVDVPRIREEELITHPASESSAAIRTRVCAARERQLSRFHGRRIYTNAQMASREIREFCPVQEDTRALLRTAIQQLGLSARAFDRILKVARTIADLDGDDAISAKHVAEAIQYRTLDRKMWI
jgi:magnesium chelatase family protein